jgi:type II secretory pathway component GspD/PulD (secretin)
MMALGKAEPPLRRSGELRPMTTIFHHSAGICFAVSIALNALSARAQTWIDVAPESVRKENERVREALKRRIDVQFVDTPVWEVADYFEAQLGIAVEIDARVLDDLGIDTNQAITFEAKQAPAGEALTKLLQQVDLMWLLTDGVVLITNQEHADEILLPRLYLVRDLLAAPQGHSDPKEYDQMVDAIAAYIDSEQAKPKKEGVVIKAVPACGALLIVQNQRTHDKIEALLSSLRHAARLQWSSQSTEPAAP